MATSNNTTVAKKVNENQARISKIGKEAKSLQKSLGATRSFLLEYKSELGLSAYEVRFLLATKKNQLLYDKLKGATQHTKSGTTCVYWVVRTLQKFERELVAIPVNKKAPKQA